MPVLLTGDRRAIGWLNETRVVLALAHHNNEWSYVGRIVSWNQETKRFDREKHNYLTKPGAASVCKRLADPERGILEVRLARTPKKRVDTPHYRIVPTLDGLSKILLWLDSGALSIVRKTEWGQELIAKDLVRYLMSKFKTDMDHAPVVNPIRFREIEFMARHSTKALEILLGPKQFDVPKDADQELRLRLSIDRLRDVMHLACALEIVSSADTQLKERKWSGEIDLKSFLRFESMSQSLWSRFATDGQVKNLPKEDEDVAEKRIPTT